jgi:hypothetical protein
MFVVIDFKFTHNIRVCQKESVGQKQKSVVLEKLIEHDFVHLRYKWRF